MPIFYKRPKCTEPFSRRTLPLCVLAGTLVCAAQAYAASQVHSWVDCKPTMLDPDLLTTGAIDGINAAIPEDRMGDVLQRVNGSLGAPSAQIGTSDYVIVHVVRWKDLAAGATTQEIDKQNWYVYFRGKWTQEDYAKNNRIFGVDHVWIVYIHLNRQTPFYYSADYSFTVTQKLPIYLNNLFNLLGAFASLGTTTPPVRAPAPPYPQNVWNAKRFPIEYKTSDIAISPAFNVMKDQACTMPTGTQAKSVTAVTIDNEGKSFIDFSVGVPIKKISQLQFNSTQNTITPQTVDTTNAFALLNVYVPKVDLKNTTASWIPHLIAGVAVAHQPLHKVLLGGAVGAHFAQFYIGALFVTDRVTPGLKCDAAPSAASASTSLTTRTCAQLSYGLNIPVGGLVQALSKKSSGASTSP
jgi:hypothetical protein